MLRVAADLSAPGVGDGLTRLERARPDTVPSKVALKAMADGGDWRSADSAAASVRSAELSSMARKLLRPQPLNPPEPRAEPRAPAHKRSAAQKPTAPPTVTGAGEKAATTPAGKPRKRAAVAAKPEGGGS